MMFNNRIKELRLKRAMSQKQLARELNCSQSSVGFWETGERIPSFEKLQTTVDIYTHISQTKIRNENIKINQYFNSLIV